MANEFRVKNGLIVGNTKQMFFNGTTGKLTIGSDLTTTVDETLRDEALLHLITNNDDSDGDGVVSYDMIIERQMGDADSPNNGPILALMSSNTDNSGSGSTDMIDDTNIGQLLWRAHTDSSEANFGSIRINIQDASNAAKDAKMFFKVQKANSMTEFLTLDGGNDKVVVPNSGFQIGSGATVTTIATSTSLSTSNTTLSTTGAIKSYVDSSVGAAGGGDITAVTAGDGLTGGASTGAATLTVGAGTGITVNTNDIQVTAAQTGITSVVNASLEIGRDADNRIKFGTDNQIIFEVSGGDNVIFKASGEIEATSLDISGDVDVDGTLEADAITLGGTAVAVSGGAFHDGFSDFVANEHIDHSGVSISAGTGMTGGGTIASTRTLNVIGGDGITANANDVAITAAQTTITSVHNASLAVGRDSHNQIDFSTDNEIHFKTNNETPVIKMKASGEIEATKFDGALEGNADTATALATARAINGVNFDGTGDITVTAAGSTLSDTVTVAKGGTGQTSYTNGQLLIGNTTGNTLAKATLSAGSNITITNGTGSISIAGTANDDVSVANLKTRLAGGFGSNAVTIGDSNDVVTIGNDLTVTGDLIVSGDTVTVDTATLVVEDPLIKLAKGNAADTVDVGIYAQYTESSTTKYAGIIRDASVTGDPWTFFDSLTTEPTTTATVGSNNFDFADVKAGGITAVDGFTGDVTGDVTGNADTATALATARAINGVNFDGTGDITVTAAGSTLSDTVTVAKGGTGATTLTDGGILLGSGTGAITAMAVLADGAMIVGDGTTDPVAESGATLRTSIGVGTGDSPQFTAIELGHASDTTIARSSAGVVTIEGAEVRTGTVAVSKGGTGVTTMTALKNALDDETWTFANKLTADAGIDIDNFNIDGTTIALSSGDMTLDAAGDIILDAEGTDIILSQDGTNFGRFKRASGDFVIKADTNNEPMVFKGVDNSSTITALTLEMADAGAATFNAGVTIGGDLIIPDDIVHSGDTDNLISFGTDTQSFETGGTARFNISDSGLQIGSGARVTTIDTGTSLSTSNTTLSTTGAIKSYVDSSVGAAGGGDITSVQDGDGLTGGADSGGVTLTVGAGDGITVNTNDVAVTAAQTTITSVLNASLVAGRDAHNQIKFSTDDQIIFRVGNADGVTFKASGEIEATSLDISGDVDVDGTLEADAITLAGTAVAVSGGAFHDGFSDFVANEHIDHSGVSITAGDGLTGGGTIASTRTLAVGAGTGVTVNANDVAIGQAVGTSDDVTFSTVTLASDLIHSGDTNNKIAFGTDTQSFQTGGTARFNISDSGLQIGSGARVTEIENNDSLGTSDTKLATQGNIKAYVDANAGGASEITDLSDALKENDSIYLGSSPTASTNTAEFNVAVGVGALDAITTGDKVTAIGKDAATALTTGERTVIMGYEAGKALTTDGASYSVIIGSEAMATKTDTGGQNVVIGWRAGNSMTSGEQNTFIGKDAGYNTTTGSHNVTVGSTARTGTTSSYGVMIGSGAGGYTDTGGYNTGIGYRTSRAITSGQYNIGIGPETLNDLTTGSRNIMIGGNAGDNFDAESDNIGIGYDALGAAINGGEKNVTLGNYSLDAVTSGDNNVALGHQAGSAVNSGSSNITIGYQAGDNITSGSNNLVIGALDTGSATQDSAIRIGNGDGSVTWINGDSNGIRALKIKVQSVSSNTTVTDDQSGSYIYWTGGTLTLPTTAESGQQYTIINNTGGAATPNLGGSNAIASGWTSHAAMADETARTYVAVAANTWIYIG